MANSFELLENTYYTDVKSINIDGVYTWDGDENFVRDNYFEFPLKANNYVSEPFQIGGPYGINFVHSSNSCVKLCDYKFIDYGDSSFWIELIATSSSIDGLLIPLSINNLSCEGINQQIWNYLADNVCESIESTNIVFDEIKYIRLSEIELFGTLCAYYKNTDTLIIGDYVDYTCTFEDYCVSFSVYIDAYEDSLGLSEKSFTFNFSNGNLVCDYLLIPKLNKIKFLLTYDSKLQPIFGPNSIDAILNRLTENRTILISGEDVSSNKLTATLLTFKMNNVDYGVDYKVVPYGVDYDNMYGSVTSYDLAFKQTGMTYYLNYSSTNNAINTSTTGISVYNRSTLNPTNITKGQQRILVYIFDEDESRSYTDIYEYNNAGNLLAQTNFIPCYPTTLLYTSGTTLSQVSSNLLESISYGFRNPDKTRGKNIPLAQGNITPSSSFVITFTGCTNSSFYNLRTFSVIGLELSFLINAGTGVIKTAAGQSVNLNNKSGTTSTIISFYDGSNVLITSGETNGRFNITSGTINCARYTNISFTLNSGITSYNVILTTSFIFNPLMSMHIDTTNGNNLVSCTGSFSARYGKNGSFFNFNIGSSAYSSLYSDGTTYYYPPLCMGSFLTGGNAMSNGAITKEGFSFTSKKFLMVDGVPRACNNSYFLSGNMILLPDYIKGDGDYILYIGARKITKRILDRSYGVYDGELTFTTDYVCGKSFKNNSWSSYTHSALTCNNINNVYNVGRNLLRNTTSFTWGPTSSNYYYSGITPTIGFKPNTMYTFSAKKMTITNAENSVTFYVYDLTQSIGKIKTNYYLQKNSDGIYSFSFITPSSVTSTDKFLIYSGIQGETSGHTLHMSYFKLEEGSSSTEWSPAPEDTDSFLNTPFKCADMLATSNDITEKICCLFAPSYRYSHYIYLDGVPTTMYDIYNYVSEYNKTDIEDFIDDNYDDVYGGGSGFVGIPNFEINYVKINDVSIFTLDKFKGCYSSDEYNIRLMVYPTFLDGSTTVINVSGICISYDSRNLIILSLANDTSVFLNGYGSFNRASVGLYYYDGLLVGLGFGGTVSGEVGQMRKTKTGNDIFPNSFDRNGFIVKADGMYKNVINKTINCVSGSINPLCTFIPTSGGIGDPFNMCGESDLVPTVERVFRGNTLKDYVSYQCYGIMKFDFEKMLYYMDTSVYLKIINNNCSFQSLHESFSYVVEFLDRTSETVYPFDYDDYINIKHIKPTLNVTDDMAEINFRMYETNHIPFNVNGDNLTFYLTFGIRTNFPLSSGMLMVTTDEISIKEILLQQGIRYQDSVFRYIPSENAKELINNATTTISYGSRQSGSYALSLTGLRLTCTTTSASSYNYGARWTASTLTKLRNLTGTSQSRFVKSGTSVITTAIIIPSTLTTTAITANPLNYNTGNVPLVGTLNMQNKPVNTWYLLHCAVSNAPNGSYSHTSVYSGGTSFSRSRTNYNIYTSYLDTLPSYIFGGFRPANNTTYILKNYIIKYIDISYLSDVGYNNIYQ